MASTIFFLCIALLAPVFVYGGATFTDCGGPDSSMIFEDLAIEPDPIQYPGNIGLRAAVKVLKALPDSGLELKLDLAKLYPRRYRVPCFNFIGSCTYEICGMIENHKTEFCPMYPNPDDCGCPIKPGNYSLKHTLFTIPDYGKIFTRILAGRYEGNMTYYDKATKKQLGCCSMTWDVKPPSAI